MATLLAAILALAGMMGIGGIAAAMIEEINAAVEGGSSVQEIAEIASNHGYDVDAD